MSYGYLPQPLHPAADAARRFMHTEWGISDSKILVEQAIDKDIVPAPTLQAPQQDHHLVCIEVSESAYPRHLDSVVFQCVLRGLPVLFYVAMFDGEARTDDLTKARNAGVGTLLVDPSGVTCRQFTPAQSLSLIGARDPKPKTWPPKYRQRISGAYDSFKNGDPAKGCSLVYDEIERLTRRICKKAEKKGWWRNLAKGSTIPDADNPKVALGQIAKFMYDHFDPKSAGTPDLDGVFGSVVGVLRPRNDSAHPKNLKALSKRDLEARTRFESATDVLRDLVLGSAPLRLS